MICISIQAISKTSLYVLVKSQSESTQLLYVGIGTTLSYTSATISYDAAFLVTQGLIYSSKVHLWGIASINDSSIGFVSTFSPSFDSTTSEETLLSFPSNNSTIITTTASTVMTFDYKYTLFELDSWSYPSNEY